MRNYTIAIALLLVPKLTLAEPEIVPLKITVQCISNSECAYDGGNLKLEFTVTNIQPMSISLPVDYIARRGPFIKLTDVKTGRRISVGTGIPDYALRSTPTTLAPGAHFKFRWSISKYEMEELESRPIDASADVTLIDIQTEKDSGVVRKFIGRTSFHIAQ